MANEQAFDDICEAIWRLRIAFQKHHLEPPKALELSSRDDVMRLRHALPPEMFLTQIKMGNQPNVVGEIMGVEIRAPARFRALRRGLEVE